MTPAELKTRRAKLGLSQQKLADTLGVSRNTVARWEMGSVPITEPAARLLKTLRGKKPSPRRTS